MTSMNFETSQARTIADGSNTVKVVSGFPLRPLAPTIAEQFGIRRDSACITEDALTPDEAARPNIESDTREYAERVRDINKTLRQIYRPGEQVPLIKAFIGSNDSVRNNVLQAFRAKGWSITADGNNYIFAKAN